MCRAVSTNSIKKIKRSTNVIPSFALTISKQLAGTKYYNYMDTQNMRLNIKIITNSYNAKLIT